MHQLLLFLAFTGTLPVLSKRLMLVCFGYWVTMRMFSWEIRLQMCENIVNIDTSLLKEKKSLSAVDSEEQRNKQLSHHHSQLVFCFTSSPHIILSNSS